MPFAILPIALLLAAACALINLWLSVRVGQARRREGIWVGDGGSDALVRRMRAQANFTENAPFVVVLVALIELCAGSNVWLAVIAGLFVVVRILHPLGMDGWGPGRMAGAVGTMLAQLLLALWAIAIPIIAHHDLKRAESAAPTEVVVPAG